MGERTHGTIGCYQSGCRRDECKKAWATYIRDRRHRLGEQRPREDMRVFTGPRGRRGFDELTERILDAGEEATQKHWRDLVGILVRNHASEITQG